MSAAISYKYGRKTIVLTDSLLDASVDVDLDVSVPKCRNLVGGRQRGHVMAAAGDTQNLNWKLKDRKRHRTSQGPDRLKCQFDGEESKALPFGWACDRKLLGVALDCNWYFRRHFSDVKSKAE